MYMDERAVKMIMALGNESLSYLVYFYDKNILIQLF